MDAYTATIKYFKLLFSLGNGILVIIHRGHTTAMLLFYRIGKGKKLFEFSRYFGNFSHLCGGHDCNPVLRLLSLICTSNDGLRDSFFIFCAYISFSCTQLPSICYYSGPINVYYSCLLKENE